MCEIRTFNVEGGLGVGKGPSYENRQYLALDAKDKWLSTRMAGEIVNGLRRGSSMTEICRNSGFGCFGIEREAWFVQGGSCQALPPWEQLELMACMRESVGEVGSVQDAYRASADEVLQDGYKDRIFLSTSVPLVGDPRQMAINSSETDVGQYVRVFAKKLQADLMRDFAQKPGNFARMNVLARKFGFQDVSTMVDRMGFGCAFPFASRHRNIGLPSYPVSTNHGEAVVMNPEISIACADVLCSDALLLAEAQTASTPMIWGKMTPWRDVRYATRQANVRSLHPEMVEDREQLVANIDKFMNSGAINNISRAGYLVYDEQGVAHPSVYGSVRLHVGTKDLLSRGARVECVALSTTPDPVADACADALIYLLLVKAMESVAGGSHPKPHFSGKYENVLSSSLRRGAIDEYNTGSLDTVNVVARGVLAMIDDLERDYAQNPEILEKTRLARWGIKRLTDDYKSKGIDDFFHSGRGNISDAIRADHNKGKSPAEVAHLLKEYQLSMARIISRHEGNIYSAMNELNYDKI